MSHLSRAIGRLALVGLVLNMIIASSVFGLPGVLAAKLGSASPLAWLGAGAGMALIVLCFAEVASRFGAAGGPYLYARTAFGRLAGIEMAWLSYLARLTAAAANSNLFVIYLAEFWPRATDPVQSKLILALMILPLAAANYRGVGPGLTVSSVFTAAKLIPLALFVVVGLAAVLTRPSQAPSGVVAPMGSWLEAVLLLVAAYGGFEAALYPLGEAKNPRRDAPIALLIALCVCTLLYTLVQTVVVMTLGNPGASSRPLADSARSFLGFPGAALLAAGALVSVYGYLAGAMLVVPRLTYAMAEQGDVPAPLGWVHHRFRTPYISVMLYAGLAWMMAASAGYLQNISLSAVSRLLTYAAVCVALIVLRRRERRGQPHGEPAGFRVPGGPVIALGGLAFTAVLAFIMSGRDFVLLALTLTAGLFHWWRVRRGASSAPNPATRPPLPD